MSTGGYTPSPPPQYGDVQQQQYGFKPPPYNPGVPEPVPAPQSPATVVVQTLPAPVLGPESSRVTCSSCGATITTKVEPENTTKTHIIALILCLAGCWPCCLIPYCMDTCKSVNHYCPSCNAFQGQYKR